MDRERKIKLNAIRLKRKLARDKINKIDKNINKKSLDDLMKFYKTETEKKNIKKGGRKNKIKKSKKKVVKKNKSKKKNVKRKK